MSNGIPTPSWSLLHKVLLHKVLSPLVVLSKIADASHLVSHLDDCLCQLLLCNLCTGLDGHFVQSILESEEERGSDDALGDLWSNS